MSKNVCLNLGLSHLIRHTSKIPLGASINHVDSKEGRGAPEKTMSVHKGEGVLEAGPHGQFFCILQHKMLYCCVNFCVFIYIVTIRFFVKKYAITYEINLR